MSGVACQFGGAERPWHVRFLLTLALVCHLSGVSAAVVSPCVEASEDGHNCCMRARTEAGGAVVGFCPCPVASGQTDATDAVLATPALKAAGSVQHSDTVVTAVLLNASLADSASVAVVPPDHASPWPGSSPPCLTGSGYRC